MIAYLKGKVLKKNEKNIILNTGNVGYCINLSSTGLNEIKEGQEKEFYIQSIIREDAFELYGFESYKELTFFKKLISVNGVGARIAIDVMNVPLEKIKGAIISEDSAFLSKIKGIGPKTAKRIVLELKNKLEDEEFDREYKGLELSINQEALEALNKLGYQNQQISKILSELPKEIQTTEDIITYFIKHN